REAALRVYNLAYDGATDAAALRVLSGHDSSAPPRDVSVTFQPKQFWWPIAIGAANLLPASVGQSTGVTELATVLGLLLAIKVLANLLRYFAEFEGAKAVCRGMAALRQEMFSKALRLPMGYFRDSISDTTTRFVQDTQALSRSQLLLFGKVAREP